MAGVLCFVSAEAAGLFQPLEESEKQQEEEEKQRDCKIKRRPQGRDEENKSNRAA